MSYSFSVTASTKAEAVEAVKAEFDKVVASQAVHEADRAAAQAATEAFIAILVEPIEAELIAVSVSGYLSWREVDRFGGASVSVTAEIQAKPATQPA